MHITEYGTGAPVLVLHGGGGPMTVAGLAQHLARRHHVLAPTHPGWDGTDRPAGTGTIGDLAEAYLSLLEPMSGVTVLGSSLGGWIAAEMAVRDQRRIARLVLIDAVGVEIPGAPIRDFFALDARGVAEYSFHDSARFYVDPATVPPEQQARRAANMATMRVYAGDPYMHDPGLLARLANVTVPTLVLWGASDRIVTPQYGQAYARAFHDARFEVIPDAGHLPQLETPDATYAAIDAFLDS